MRVLMPFLIARLAVGPASAVQDDQRARAQANLTRVNPTLGFDGNDREDADPVRFRSTGGTAGNPPEQYDEVPAVRRNPPPLPSAPTVFAAEEKKGEGGGAPTDEKAVKGAAFGALGGVLLGALIGFAIGGPIGALAGAAVGLLAGIFVGAMAGKGWFG